MSYAQDLINEYTAEQKSATDTPVETVETQSEPVSSTEQVPEPVIEPVSTDDKSEEVTEPEPKEDKVTEDNQVELKEEHTHEPKPDLSKLTKEEKAAHSFQRQLAKQKAKYESSVEDIKKSFQSQIDELKKSMTSKKEEPMKQREDFDNDTDFVDYLTMRGVDKRLAERDEADAKARAEREEAEKAEREANERQQEIANYFNTNAQNAFGEQFGDFEKLVQKSVANGLADVLDQAPSVRDYIFTNPNGPVVLNEMLRNRDSFVRIMSRGASPMDAVIECHDLAREIASRAPAVEQPKQTMPNLGKPGAGSAPRTAPDMWNDDSSLIDYVRRHR